MAKKDFKKEDEQLENVEEALSTTGQWIEDNSNILMWTVIGIAAVILGLVMLNKYVWVPNGLEASNENAKAQAYFQAGEYEKALNGDDAECLGFMEIADQYKFYQQGKLAALYAGICEYQLGDFEEAAKYIKRFSANDKIVDPAAHLLLGDAYVQMDELKKAASCFEKAAKSKSEMIAPMALKKAGFVYMELGNNKAANKVFKQIKADYPASQEAQDAEKYIALTE